MFYANLFCNFAHTLNCTGLILAAAEILRSSGFKSLRNNPELCRNHRWQDYCVQVLVQFSSTWLCRCWRAPGTPANDSKQTQCHLEEKARPCTPRYKGNIFFRGINVPNETSVRTDAVFPSSLSSWAMCVRGHRAWHEGLLGNSFVINHKEYPSDLGHLCLSIISSLFPFSRARRANNNFWYFSAQFEM